MGQTPAKPLTFYKIFIIIYIENKDIESGVSKINNYQTLCNACNEKKKDNIE